MSSLCLMPKTGSAQNVVIDLITPPPSPTVGKSVVPSEGLLRKMYRPEVLLWHLKVYTMYATWMNPDPDDARRAHDTIISFCAVKAHGVAEPQPPPASTLPIPAYAKGFIRNSKPTDLFGGYHINWVRVLPIMKHLKDRAPELLNCIWPIMENEKGLRERVKSVNDIFPEVIKAAIRRRNLYDKMLIINAQPVTEEWDKDAKLCEIERVKIQMVPLELTISEWLEFAARVRRHYKIRDEFLQKKRKNFVKHHLRHMLLLIGKVKGEQLTVESEKKMIEMYERFNRLRAEFYHHNQLKSGNYVLLQIPHGIPELPFKYASMPPTPPKSTSKYNSAKEMLSKWETFVPLEEFPID